MPLWELLLLVAALAAAAFLGVDLGRGWLRRREEERHLERLGEEAPAVEDRHEPPGGVGRRLRAAGIRFGAAVYGAASALAAAVVFFGVLAAFPGSLAAAVLAVLVTVWIPWSLVGSLARWRARRFEEKLVDAVGFMIGALEVGENPTRALASAADAAEGAVAAELRRAVERLDAGTGIWRALRPMIEGYDSEGTRLFAQTLIAKWTAGGDLAPVLKSVNRIMRERFAMRLRMRSELAGARLAAVVVALLPYVLIPVFLWRRPDWIRALVEHPLGLRLLFAALLLQVVGILWLRRTMRFETR